MGYCQDDQLVNKIRDLYEKISKLETLKPCEDVDTLFKQLVSTCIPPNPNIDVTKMSENIQEMRSNLIKICGEAEGYLEHHFSSILTSFEDNPLHHLNLFPYYNNYLKLSKLEFDLLEQNLNGFVPRTVAFIGSGPLPLTSVVLASSHLKDSIFHNFDIDPSANMVAARLVSSDPDLSQRMFFHTVDIMDVTESLKGFDVVFLAALVGMDKKEKVKVVEHLEKHMSPGALLMLRSAHGPRAFLYPIVEPCDLEGFEVLSVYHPTDEVINSIVISRKLGEDANGVVHDHIDQASDLACNCSKIHVIMNKKKSIIEEFAGANEEQLT
ncbi:putative nicotianamine synthase 4 [Arabidopsis thaliana]|uniref:Nicotianamine synthase n=2 Tax=Arabidopsis TaxID=3701 RepID=A0A178WQR7_ARATH|nr:S-adenosyl-L-methionine-dependent methyltransferase [Arabidopsis thaliana x Arabidopsis arenosa]OAP19522.1 NAS4 [Arabidopsis thaliana]